MIVGAAMRYKVPHLGRWQSHLPRPIRGTCLCEMQAWVVMVAECVHKSLENKEIGPGPEEHKKLVHFIFNEWNYTRDQKLKCRDDLAWFMTERDSPETDIYWTVFRHKLEAKRYKSTTKALQETLQEAWGADESWLRIVK